MPYCSIEEAWGQGFLSDKNEPKKFKKIVPEFAHSTKLGYSSVEYPETDVYNSKAKSIYCKSKKKPHKRRKSFSRTYNRLPGHSGPATRLPNNIEKKLTFKRKKKLRNIESENHIDNMDLPINQYDKRMEQDLNRKTYAEEQDSEDEDDDDENESFINNNSNYMQEIINENRKLRNIIEKFQENKNGKDNIFDLVVFLATGVFIIFLLDMISKGIRKF